MRLTVYKPTQKQILTSPCHKCLRNVSDVLASTDTTVTCGNMWRNSHITPGLYIWHTCEAAVSKTSQACLGPIGILVVKFCGHRLRYSLLNGCRRRHHGHFGGIWQSLTHKIQLINQVCLVVDQFHHRQDESPSLVVSKKDNLTVFYSG